MRFRIPFGAAVALAISACLLSFPAALVPAASAQGARAPQTAAISADVAAAVDRMSKTLLAKEFSFRSHTIRSYVGPNGELLHIAHTSKFVLRRPDKLLTEVTGDDGSTKFMYDGQNFVVYGVSQKKYVTIPTTGDIGKALEYVEDREGLDFPLGDLLSDNPAAALLEGVTTGGEVGTAMIDGVRCHHYYFVQSPDLNMELWLEDNDRALPRRLFITYKLLPGRPTFSAELSDWDFSVHPSDSEFVFNPPPGVQQMALKPEAAAPTGTQK
jgi:hypothetical protein